MGRNVGCFLRKFTADQGILQKVFLSNRSEICLVLGSHGILRRFVRNYLQFFTT
jgi:hypothetical protein